MQVYVTLSVADTIIHQYQTIYRSEVRAANKHHDLIEFSPFNVHQKRLPEQTPFLMQVQTWPSNEVIAITQIEDVAILCATVDDTPNGKSITKFPISLKNAIDNSAKIVLLKTSYLF